MNYSNLYSTIDLPMPLTEEEFKKYYQEFKKGDMSARDILISHNLRLVITIITAKFSETQYELEELISIGNIGLIKAIDTYDEEKNNKFSSYASTCIINEVLTVLRKDKNKPIINSLYDGYGETEDDLIMLKDIIPDPNPSIYEQLIEKRIRTIIYTISSKIINSLNPREKDIIIMYFGFKDGKRYRQKEIANKYGLQQTYISKIIANTLRKIKNNIEFNPQLEELFMLWDLQKINKINPDIKRKNKQK